MSVFDWFLSLSHVGQAAIATIFTWLMTAIGASLVFFFKDINKKVLDMMLGTAAGVMIAASFWSLLNPAIQMEEARGGIGWMPAVLGFLLGAFFLRLVDRLLPHLHGGIKNGQVEGIKVKWNRNTLLILAITLHNIPEGLAVGVVFGSLASGTDSVTMAGAISLALGIGLQNLPEGAAVSLPLLSDGRSRWRAFMAGQFSGIVEIAGGVLGAYAVIHMSGILPYALSFAAGAMIYVVVEELIPESQRGEHNDLATMGTMAGFALMMFLDVALG
jgi:ZIP family zinc transporter